MIKRIKELNKDEIFKKCYNTCKCEGCDLNIESWCLMKNKKEQMENYLGPKKMEKYLNKEVAING